MGPSPVDFGRSTRETASVFAGKWIQIVKKNLFRDLMKRRLNDLDYLMADIRIHSPCEVD